MPGSTSGEVSGTSISQWAYALPIRRWQSEDCLSRLSECSYTLGTVQSKRLPFMPSRPSFTQSLFTVSTSSAKRTLSQVKENQPSEIRTNFVRSQSVPAMLEVWNAPQSNTSATSGSSSMDSWTDSTASLSTIYGPSSSDGALNPLDSANSKFGKNDSTQLFGLNKFSLSGNLQAGPDCMPNCWRRLIDFFRQKLKCRCKKPYQIEPDLQPLFYKFVILGFKAKTLKKLLADFGPQALQTLNEAWDKLGEINTADYADNICHGTEGLDVNSYAFLSLSKNKPKAILINARRHALKSLAPDVLQELSQMDANLQQNGVTGTQVIKHMAPDLITKLSTVFVDMMEHNHEEMLYHFPAYLFERPLDKYPAWSINLYLRYLIRSHRRHLQSRWQDISNSLQAYAENNNKVVPWEKIRVHAAYQYQQGIAISLDQI